jgi:hypothetical protein
VSQIESASDAFVCLPSASDVASLDDAFEAVGEVYLNVWRACDKKHSLPNVPRQDLSALEVYFHELDHDDIDDDALFRSVVTQERRHRARGLGPSVDHVFRFYVQKAIADHRGYIGPLRTADPYQPWLHIGFPLLIESVTIETTEDGLDWLRFGTIGPVAFGFTGSVPTRVHTACFKRTDDLEGYEVVFVGEEIDVAGGAML